MDALSILGLTIAFGAIILGQHLEGGQLLALVNGPAILIVGGGTVGAIMLQSPFPVFMKAVRISVWILRPPVPPMEDTLDELVRWGQVARKEGLLGLENIVEHADDLFARKGLQLLVDGNEPETIRSTLELENNARETHELQAARVFDGMGGYAPTIGIIGAVMGLIHVMGNLAESESAWQRYRSGVRCHHLWCRPGEPGVLACRQQTEKSDPPPKPLPRSDHRGHCRNRPRRKPTHHRNAPGRTVACVINELLNKRGQRESNQPHAPAAGESRSLDGVLR